MKYEIRSIDSKIAAKITSIWLALISSLVGILGVIILILGFFTKNRELMITSAVYILMPILYLVFGYIFTRFSCWIYNIIAKKFGGYEVFLNDIKSD